MTCLQGEMHAKVLCTGFVLINLRSKRKAITHLCKSKPLKSSPKVVAFLNLFSSSARPAVKPAIRETDFAARRGEPPIGILPLGSDIQPAVVAALDGARADRDRQNVVEVICRNLKIRRCIAFVSHVCLLFPSNSRQFVRHSPRAMRRLPRRSSLRPPQRLAHHTTRRQSAPRHRYKRHTRCK